jgi:O-antigen ligase
MGGAPWLAVGAAGAAVLAWLALRRPTVLLLSVLATLAVGPQWLLADGALGALGAWAMPAQTLLLLAALLANVARYGLRLDGVNWPLVAVLWLLCQSLLLADLDPAITPAALLGAALSFALPWCVVHVALEPGSRVRYALLIALLPALCVLAGAALQLAGLHPLFSGSQGRGLRLQGASNAAWLAFLAFTGFAVALHEAVRRRRLDFAGLAALNPGIALMSGGRMSLIACGILAGAYVLLARGRRARIALLSLLVLGGIAGLLAFVPQSPLNQLAEVPGGLLDPNGRDRIWKGYFAEFLSSPLFGRGLGAAEHGAYHDLPHNLYLRLLVDAGLVGAALYALALIIWAWRLREVIRPGERAFAWALLLALGAYAFTDNVLIMPAGAIPFVYLAIMRTRSRRGGSRRRASAGLAAQPAASP